jgi:protein gp37
LFELIEATPNLDWLLLTKRIGNAARMIEGTTFPKHRAWPWPNVWLGATIVNQEEADRDIPRLLATPAAKRFLSVEPMLGPLDLSYWIEPTLNCCACGEYYGLCDAVPDPDGHNHGADECSRCGVKFCMTTWWGHEAIEERSRPDDTEVDQWDSGYRLHWVICGGESGPKARPSHPDWFRSLRDQCQAAGVPFLFKQWGEWLPWAHFGDARVDDPPEQTRFRTMEFVDSAWVDVGYPDTWATMDGEIDDMQCVGRVGKKAAGRLLDGVEHSGFPA